MKFTFGGMVLQIAYICTLGLMLTGIVEIGYGIHFKSSENITLGCYLLGYGTTAFSALSLRPGLKEKLYDRLPLRFMNGLAFILVSGMAVYYNIVWLLWKFGADVEESVINAGLIGQHYWLGLILLLFALLTFLGYKKSKF